MNQPGVWILGELDDKVRNAVLGVAVEYANDGGVQRFGEARPGGGLAI